mmetsp:Transcript_32961/g.111894  ORF Transcript_32961/g.111894 Transcript_32961/m.111894 type:complete len:130 (-) Transcript_32961:481-870(-)
MHELAAETEVGHSKTSLRTCLTPFKPPTSCHRVATPVAFETALALSVRPKLSQNWAVSMGVLSSVQKSLRKETLCSNCLTIPLSIERYIDLARLLSPAKLLALTGWNKSIEIMCLLVVEFSIKLSRTLC